MPFRIRAVFFDLGETLVTQNIEDNIVTRRALLQVAKILDKPKSGADLYRIYRHGYRINQSIRSRHHVEIPVQTWMRELLASALGKAPRDFIVERAIRIIVKSRAANAIAFKDARPALQSLARSSVKLGVISNVSSHDVALEIMKKVRIFNYFDRVITSAQTGIRKPDPGIFLYALRQFGLKPEETVHVGDSEVHDVRGAKSVGITTVLVTDQAGRAHTDADYRFRNLQETMGFLGSL